MRGASAEEERKLLGKYYTPIPLAQTMASWAVRGKPAKIFDPCFGEGSLLVASLKALKECNISNPGRLLFGVDIDEETRKNLPYLLDNGAHENNFMISDFLSLRPCMIPEAPFDVIISNPPFVRHHYITKEKLATAKLAVSEANVKIPGTAGYWAYFLIHSLRFLKTGGRLAMISPMAFLQADYSVPVRQYIAERFDHVETKVVNGRWFEEAQEASIILFAEDCRAEKDVLHNKKAYRPYMPTKRHVMKKDYRTWNVWLNILPSKIGTMYRTMSANPDVTTLGNWAKVRIGVVTGANNFFVIAISQKRKLGIEDRFLKPIVCRSNAMRGLSFKAMDFSEIEEGGYPSRLLVAPDIEGLPESIERYLEWGKSKDVDKRFKCRVRKPWYAVGNHYAPDAFFHYMSSSLPHIVLNSYDATCTNAIHRLMWAKKLERTEEHAISVASTTSITQLSCELVGRSYGGGLLKLEPSRAIQILLPVPPASANVDRAFAHIDTLLRKGEKAEATTLADDFVLKGFLDLNDGQILRIRKALDFIICYRTRLLSELPYTVSTEPPRLERSAADEQDAKKSTSQDTQTN